MLLVVIFEAYDGVARHVNEFVTGQGTGHFPLRFPAPIFCCAKTFCGEVLGAEWLVIWYKRSQAKAESDHDQETQKGKIYRKKVSFTASVCMPHRGERGSRSGSGRVYADGPSSE